MEIQSRLYVNKSFPFPTAMPARAENIKPSPLDKSNIHLPVSSAILKAYFLSKPSFGTTNPTKHQVLVVPIGIGEIKPGRDIQVGSTSVLKVEGKSQKPIPIDVYRMVQDGAETYKLVVQGKHGKPFVVGYSIMTHENDKIVVPLLGTTNTQYKVGKALAQLAVERMMQENAKEVKLIASWNSHGFHRSMGFKAKDPEPACKGEEIDQKMQAQIEEVKLAEQKHQEANLQPLGCNIMFLPKSVVEEKCKDGAILSHLEAGIVGVTSLTDRKTGNSVTARVIKKTDPFGMEVFKILVGKNVVGSIVLNYYEVKNGEYQSKIGKYPEWSPFAKYGNDPKDNGLKNKVFAEYWCLAGGERFIETEIQQKLFKLAIERSLEGYGGNLQIETDWDEHLNTYQYGFRAQDINPPFTRGVEIDHFIAQELSAAKAAGRSPNTHVLGSTTMILSQEDAMKQWAKVIEQTPIFQNQCVPKNKVS